MKERTKRLQALFCALAVTATSVGSPLVSVPVYAEETQGAEDTSEHPETENGKATDTSDNAISESPDQVEKLIPENPNPEPVTEDEGDSSQKTTVAAEAAQTPQAAAVQEAQKQEAQIQEAETVTPKESTLTVKINGTAASGESLEAAVTASGTEAAAVTRLDLISGTITQADLAYITTLTSLQDFHMQLGSGLKLIGKTGSATTVLGKNTAVLNFAPKASGSSKGALRSVELGGVTEILTGGIVSDSVETISMPDVVNVGANAFKGFGWLESISLPKAETIGSSAFFNCTRMTSITLESVKTLETSSFENTNSLTKLTLPATIQTIKNIKFGTVSQGNKVGTRLVMKGMTPPKVTKGAFSGISQNKISTVTVPVGALDAYLAQINAENSSAGLISKRETMWNNLYLREEGSYAVEYYSEYVTGVKVAYVKAGEGITAEKVASATKAGNIFKGWNTKKNGTGEAFGEGSVPTDDITVYPVFAAACTIQVHQEDGTTTKLEVEKGQAIGENLPAAPTKEGYLFKGWNTSADGTGETVTADTVITENMDLYPIFEEDIPPVVEVRVVFDVDGQKSEVKVVKGEAIGSNLPVNPEKEGYTFKGWNTKADGTGEAVTAETVATDEMEVYAVFEQNPAPIEEVRVIFDVDGVKSEVKVVKGEAIGSKLPAAPEKEGYTFKGWNTKADGTGETVTADTLVSDDLEVFAIFEKTETPKDPEKPDPGKGDDTKKPETPTPTPTPTTTPTNTNTTKKNNTTTGTTTPASKTTTTAQTAKTVKTADATPLASTAAAGGLSLLGMLTALFGKKKK